MAETTLTSEQVHEFLRRDHANYAGTDAWVYYEELETDTGTKRERRLDAWAMHLWPSTNYKRITFEVKISRSDFLREIAAPQKRKLGLLYSNLFYFVTPAGLVKAAEIPAECGLIEYEADGRSRVIVAAPWRDTDRPSWGFMAAAMRQAQRLADKRVRDKVLHELSEREAKIAAEHAKLDAAKVRLRDEWDKCRVAQREAGLNPHYNL